MSSELNELYARAAAYLELAEYQWREVERTDKLANEARLACLQANVKYDRLLDEIQRINTAIADLIAANEAAPKIVSQEAVMVDGNLVMATVSVGPDSQTTTINDSDRE